MARRILAVGTFSLFCSCFKVAECERGSLGYPVPYNTDVSVRDMQQRQALQSMVAIWYSCGRRKTRWARQHTKHWLWLLHSVWAQRGSVYGHAARNGKLTELACALHRMTSFCLLTLLNKVMLSLPTKSGLESCSLAHGEWGVIMRWSSQRLLVYFMEPCMDWLRASVP